MKLSETFFKTQKNAPAGEESRNAIDLIRAGYIYKEMSGAYDFLPLGRKVLDNIVAVIRDEMNAIGGNEVSMTALQNPEIWQKTDRWDDAVVDNWFKSELKNGSPIGLGFTHEEAMTNMMRQFIASYKDLPTYPYQFQTKFRNELRAKSGIMRGREFLMKDLYSFSRDEAEHQAFYNRVSDAYLRIFKKLGLGEITYKTFASGGTFAKYSHEFQTITDAGEDIIYVDEAKNIAINAEVLSDEVLADLGLNRNDLVEKNAVEVGNIFTLADKFSEPLGLKFTDEDGSAKNVFMGSYGIGPSRIMGTIAEVFADERGLVWPENIAPAQVYLIGINTDKKAEQIYNDLTAKGIEVIWDDRNERPGTKFGDADLLGIPYRVVVSEKLGDKIEIKKRTENEPKLLTDNELFDIFNV